MFWQSSLLIGLLWAIDLVLRRRLRAAVRYALWLMVLVKLVLPPSLAFPTGLGWWLRAAPTSEFHTVTVLAEGGTAAIGETPGRSVSLPAASTLDLSGAALVLLFTAGITTGLLAWMLFRSRGVALMARAAAPPLAPLEKLLEESSQAVGFRGRVHLKVLDEPVSPALCGLLHPVILLPRSVAEQLTPPSLRVVLAHELVHLRRRDVWVNCFQAVLQCLYWWHPLVWFANRRLRQAREEAVDDTVLLALGNDVGQYAPTLLEVAKLSVRRPLATLGLVGILESHSALRQRIDRLVNRPLPRCAGLTLVSAISVLAFAAAGLPMGQAPARLNPASEGVIGPAGPAKSATDPASRAQREVPHYPDELSPSPSVPAPALATAAASEALRELSAPSPSAQTNAQAPSSTQLHIKIKFVAVPEAVATEFWTRFDGSETVASNTAQTMKAKAALDALAQFKADPRCELLAESSVITFPGRQCEIECVNVQTVVTNVQINPAALQPPGFTGTNGVAVSYQTTSFASGPRLNIVADRLPNSDQLRLTAIPTLKQFLGYDKPTTSIVYYANGKKLYATPPLPRFHIDSVTNSATLTGGDTLVLGGITSIETRQFKDKVPFLGDIPLLGGLFRSESTSTERKPVLVIITPTLIDPTGKPLQNP